MSLVEPRRPVNASSPWIRALSDAEITNLFRRWRDHDDEIARERLVSRYLPLAYSLARRYRGANEPLDDLRQVAAFGLLRAIDRFDPDRGVGFAAFATPSILGELRRYFRDCGWMVHVPRGLQERAQQIEVARRTLAREHAVVTAQVLAEYLELTVECVVEALAANDAHHAISLDAPSDSEGDEAPRWAGIGCEDRGYDRAEWRADLQRAAKGLDVRERAVLELRHQHDLTQVEIGARVGESQMQISRILRRAESRLADALVEADPVD